jgi:hypothetical protein
MSRDCQECQRLWREYAAATTAHISAENKLRRAAVGRDIDAIAALTPHEEVASQKRAAAREAIRQHETATGHGARATTAE